MTTNYIRKCLDNDFESIYRIINDSAMAYEGHIPKDRWKDPYMPREDLQNELDSGVVFWVHLSGDELTGVMGIQDVKDVTLIRHAYVKTSNRNEGIGGELLAHLRTLTERPVLIGTWKDAVWAVRFYEKYGYRMVTEEEKNFLLKKYWNIPERQVDTSVVLTDGKLNLPSEDQPEGYQVL